MSHPKVERIRKFTQFKKDGIVQVNSRILMNEKPDYSKLIKKRGQDTQKDLVICSWGKMVSPIVAPSDPLGP
jgi:hypothetical protein